MTALSARVGDVADEILEQMLMAEPLTDRVTELQCKTFIPGLDRLWPVDFNLIDQVADEMDGGGRFYLAPGQGEESELAEIFWPIDIGIAVKKEGYIFLGRTATIEHRELRGLVKIVPSKTVALSSARLKDGKWDPTTDICGFSGGKWTPIGNDVVHQRTSGRTGNTSMSMLYYSPEDKDQIDDTISMSFSVRLTERYSWHVGIGFHENGPRLVLPTNPKGCLNLFRARDSAPGARRRSALRHWVNEHYRDRSADPGAIDYVREHLRGNTRFIWNGLDCELMVSEFDLEKNEFFKAQAAEWRAMRTHNRIRLRRKGARTA